MKIIVKRIEIYVRIVTIQTEKIYKNNEKKRKFDDSVNNIEKTKIDYVNNKINVPTHENHAHVVIVQEMWAKPITC